MTPFDGGAKKERRGELKQWQRLPCDLNRAATVRVSSSSGCDWLNQHGPFSLILLGGTSDDKAHRLAWPEPSSAAARGADPQNSLLCRLASTLNRDEMYARVAAGTLSHEDAQRLIQEDEHRKAINAILGYFSFWELRDWREQVEKTGLWSPPPSLIGMRRKAVWEQPSMSIFKAKTAKRLTRRMMRDTLTRGVNYEP